MKGSEHNAPDGSYDTWYANIYNYSLGAWVNVGQSTGTNPSNNQPDYDGWIFHESSNIAGTNGTCYQVKSVSAGNVLLRQTDAGWYTPGDVPSAWTEINRTYYSGQLNCWSTGIWQFDESNPYWGWTMASPYFNYY